MALSDDSSFLIPGMDSKARPLDELPPPDVEANYGIYNVAGGYATGPNSNPYGLDVSYQGGQTEENATTSKAIVTQPGGEADTKLTEEQKIEFIKSVSIREVILKGIASAIVCWWCGLMSLLASLRFRSAMKKGDTELALLELVKAKGYSKLAVQAASAVFFILTFIIVVVTGTRRNHY